MNIINVHTHVFDEQEAKRQDEIWAQYGVAFYAGFAVSGLLKDMAKCGIATSVIFCVAERPDAVKAANDFVIATQDKKKLVGMGTIHPDSENYKEEIKRLKQHGVRGVKFNSLVQGDSFVDDDNMLRIYEELGSDMVLFFHAGRESGKPVPHSTPERLARVLKLFPRHKIVAAHFGGLDMLDDVRKHLLGKEIYFDTVWGKDFSSLDNAARCRLIQDHGSHRVLFGTDYPAFNTQERIDWVSQLPLSSEDRELVFHRNAERLFGLKP